MPPAPDPSADARLRAARRERVLDAMEERGIDVLVLGRRDSVAYASGTRGLWTAGTRPFGAACVVVGADRSVHLLSTWDTGIPPEVPFENLYGVTWNPATMASALGSIAGLAEARRLGVDTLSPGFARAAARIAPNAEIVPVDDLLSAVRAVKLPAEVERIAAAVAVARAGVETVAAALAGGATPAEAQAAVAVALAGWGITVPTSAPVVALIVADDPLVHVDIGVLVDGYEGARGRTLSLAPPPDGPAPDPVSSAAGQGAGASDRSADDPGRSPRDDRPAARLDALAAAQQRLIDACRPGATAADLREAAAGASGWIVRGAGMGFEHPVVTQALGDGVVLAAGNVLSVEVDIDGLRRRDLVHVGPDTTEVL